MQDSYGRQVDYLRLSITDRCNLKCLYCMPEQGISNKKQDEILSFEEIIRVVSIAAKCGLFKIRLTGGEPLVRKGVEGLAYRLVSIDGIKGLSLTTNGLLLADKARALKEAGVGRVNISVDTLDRDRFKWLTRGGDINNVIKGLDASLEAGLTPVKINVVALRELKDGFIDFVNLTREKPVHVRFIEYMPIGSAGMLSRKSYISADEIMLLINKDNNLTETCSPGGWGPARYYKVPGAPGTIGFIGAESKHFCNLCNRMRMTADGRLRPCLFSSSSIDIRSALRSGKDDAFLENIFKTALKSKPESRPSVETEDSMSKIGG